MNSDKGILAIETSADLCSVCAWFSREKYFELSVKLKHSHAEHLFGLIDTVTILSGTALNEYMAIAVSEGPGSFTGLRIGYSAAKGLAAGSDIRIIPVPTFEAWALHISTYLTEGTNFIIANRVNTDEIYFSRFFIKGNSYIFAENLKILTAAEFLEKSEDMLVFGNAAGKNNVKNTLFAPPARAVAEWAVLFGSPVPNFDFIEPNYMKNFIIKEKRK